MKKCTAVINPFIRLILKVIAEVDTRELARVPAEGPLIIVLNHINFLEVPVTYLALLPRKTHGIIKAETWNNLFLGKIADLWEAIPIHRNGTDLTAMRRAGDVLQGGGIIVLAPEGTRSGDGVLRPGQGGVVSLALKYRATIVPVAHYGGERFWENIKKVRRTRIAYKAGRPFTINSDRSRVNTHVRKAIVDEIMDRIAELLPEEYRGVYAAPETRHAKFLSY